MRLEGASEDEAKEIEKHISALGDQVFLLHNVHEGNPRLLHTRWSLSCLYGPMTRDPVARVMAPHKAAPPPPGEPAPAPADSRGGARQSKQKLSTRGFVHPPGILFGRVAKRIREPGVRFRRAGQ